MKQERFALLILAIVVVACVFWRRQVTEDVNQLNTKCTQLASVIGREPKSEQALSATGLKYSNSKWNTSDDPDLVQFIKDSWLHPPSGEKPNYDDRKDHSQFGQLSFVRRLLKDRVGGFFVECGAASGQNLSNTIDLERDSNWTGLLVEANPTEYNELVQINRNAYSINACLSPSNRTNTMGFMQNSYVGGLLDTMDKSHLEMIKRMKKTTYITVQCFPLYSILLALGRTHVDYFSLDVEGGELEILRTIPWHKISIDVLTVEYLRRGNKGTDKTATSAALQQMRALFQQTGLYKEVGTIGGLDVVFKRID